MILASGGPSATSWIGIVIVVSLLIPIVGAWRGAGMFKHRLEFGPEGWSATPVSAANDALQQLIQDSLAAQERSSERLVQLTTEIGTLGTRIAEVERLLADVG